MSERPAIVSPIVTAGVKFYVKSRVSKRRVRRGRTVRFSGTVRPARPGANIAFQKKRNGRWVSINGTIVRSGGRYSKRVKIRRGGSYRVVDRHRQRRVHVQPRPHVPPPHVPLTRAGERRAPSRGGRGAAGGYACDVIVDVAYDERYWYPDDGGEVWLAGYQVVDPGLGQLPGARRAGADRARPAGRRRGRARRATTARRSAPTRSRPGSRSCCGATRPTRTTPTRSPSTRPAAAEQAGWVPRETAAEIAPDLDAGRPWSAVVLREQRPSPRDPRSGLTMLLAAAEAIELRERGVVRLVTWNVAGRVTRQPEQARAVTGVGADVVALQEVTARTLPLLAGRAGGRGLRSLRGDARRAAGHEPGAAARRARRGARAARAAGAAGGCAVARARAVLPARRGRDRQPALADRARSGARQGPHPRGGGGLPGHAAAGAARCCAAISTRRAASCPTGTC